MTSPLHGEDREFESPRAHRFFFQSDAKMKTEVHEDADEKLCNFEEKLCNSDLVQGEQSVAALMTEEHGADNKMHRSTG